MTLFNRLRSGEKLKDHAGYIAIVLVCVFGLILDLVPDVQQKELVAVSGHLQHRVSFHVDRSRQYTYLEFSECPLFGFVSEDPALYNMQEFIRKQVAEGDEVSIKIDKEDEMRLKNENYHTYDGNPFDSYGLTFYSLSINGREYYIYDIKKENRGRMSSKRNAIIFYLAAIILFTFLGVRKWRKTTA